jgi:hypothetical protein
MNIFKALHGFPISERVLASEFRCKRGCRCCNATHRCCHYGKISLKFIEVFQFNIYQILMNQVHIKVSLHEVPKPCLRGDLLGIINIVMMHFVCGQTQGSI